MGYLKKNVVTKNTVTKAMKAKRFSDFLRCLNQNFKKKFKCFLKTVQYLKKILINNIKAHAKDTICKT